MIWFVTGQVIRIKMVTVYVMSQSVTGMKIRFSIFTFCNGLVHLHKDRYQAEVNNIVIVMTKQSTPKISLFCTIDQTTPKPLVQPTNENLKLFGNKYDEFGPCIQ